MDLHRRHARCPFKVAAVLAATCFAAPGDSTSAADRADGLRVVKEPFGTMPDGTPVEIYTLSNANGLEAKVMTLGATLTTVKARDRNGKSEIITLHKNTLEEYAAGHPLFGSVVGRFANRIANARFTLDGVEYRVVANAGKHHIHGGGRNEAFHWLVWKARPIEEEKAVGVELSLVSPDGQAGFPGRLEATVVYQLTADNRLIIDYTARTDKPTHVNLTNHAYWNLTGADSGEVMDHVLTLNADRYLPGDAVKMPTGEIRPVKDTPMDFTGPRTIGSRVAQTDYGCYDHCYVLTKRPGERLSFCARVFEPTSGRVMEVETTQPGVQLYTGNRKGLCLETQHFPNSPNEPKFPTTVLRPGETFHEVTIHKFGTERPPQAGQGGVRSSRSFDPSA
jgi:aldose 1-epimerase